MTDEAQRVAAGLTEMMARDHARMRAAGCELAEAALRVIRTYDGTHRLSLAVAGWAQAVANEGDRPHRATRADIDSAIVADDEQGRSLREIAKRHSVGVGRVRGALARRILTEQPADDTGDSYADD